MFAHRRSISIFLIILLMAALACGINLGTDNDGNGNGVVAEATAVPATSALFGLRSLLDELRRAAFGLVGADAVRATATAYRRFVGLHPGIYPLLLRAPEPHEAELVSLSNELVGFMQLVLATMGLQGDEAIHAIRGLRAILHGFTSLEAGGGYKLDLDLEISFQRLVDSYLAGLTRPAAWLYGQGL